MHTKKMTRNRWAAAIFFVLYILLLFYILFFSELSGRGLMNRARISYNMQPFLEIKRYLFHWRQIGLLASLLNLFGNIIGFAPLGFLLPSFSRRCRRYWYNTIMAGYYFKHFGNRSRLLQLSPCTEKKEKTKKDKLSSFFV